MVEMSFEGQHESLSSLLEVIEEEDLSYNEEITSSNDGELEKPQRVENDAQEWKTLVAKEDEPTSPESHDTTKEVVKTIPEMAPWGEKYEEFQIVKVTSYPRWKSALLSCVRKWKLPL